MTKPQSTAAYVLRLTLTLFLITVIVAGLLAFVNYLTAEMCIRDRRNTSRRTLSARGRATGSSSPSARRRARGGRTCP